jgi:hypothetical protein
MDRGHDGVRLRSEEAEQFMRPSTGALFGPRTRIVASGEREDGQYEDAGLDRSREPMLPL